MTEALRPEAARPIARLAREDRARVTDRSPAAGLGTAVKGRPLLRAAADLATVAVLAAGLGAVITRSAGSLPLALIAVATVLDGLDGPLARRAGGPSRRGALGDVIGDLVAFGLAPVAVVAAGTPHPALVLAGGAYIAASIARLVRGYRRADGAGWGFVGLPMPACAWLLLALGLGDAPLLAAGVALGVAALAVSDRPYPGPAYLRRSAARPLTVGIGVAALLALWSPRAAVLLLAAGYAAYPWREE